MKNVLSVYLDKFMLVFVDGILVCSNIKEENEIHLKTLFQLDKPNRNIIKIIP